MLSWYVLQMLSEVTESISSVHRIFILVSVYTATVSMPLPLDTSTTQTDPNIIEGQWKRRPTERATENGDLLARKKARITTASGGGKSTKWKAVTQRISTEDVSDIPHPEHCAPVRLLKILIAMIAQSTHADVQTLKLLMLMTSQMMMNSLKKKMTLPSSVHVSFAFLWAYWYDNVIDHLSKKWDAPVYVFFKHSPTIEYIENRKAHIFQCDATCCHCKSRSVQHFLYTGDTSLASNLRQHAKICWGADVVAAADLTGNLRMVHKSLLKKKDLNGSIISAFKRVGKGRVTYSTCALTKLETR